MNIHTEGVPYGDTCYEYFPAPGSGFSSKAEVDHYLENKYGEHNIARLVEALSEHERLLKRRYCKFWNPTDNGFVECLHLDRKAFVLPVNDEDIKKAISFFGNDSAVEQNVKGHLLGDAIKECKLNLGSKPDQGKK